MKLEDEKQIPEKEEYYTFQVGLKGLRCVNCVNHIENSVKEKMEGIKSASVNLVTDQLMVTTTDGDFGNKIPNFLVELGFKATYVSDVSAQMSDHLRVLTIHVPLTNDEMPTNDHNEHTQYLEHNSSLTNKSLAEAPGELKHVVSDVIQPLFGVKKVGVMKHDAHHITLNIVYNPAEIKGYDILTVLDKKERKYQVVNTVLDNSKRDNMVQKLVKASDLVISMLITVFLLVVVMLVPEIEADPYYYLTYPESLNPISMLVIFSLIFCIFSMVRYGFPCYRAAFKAFVSSRHFNMESLITLGSLSAFLFGLFWLIYGFLEVKPHHGHHDDPREMMHLIMEICDMFATATVIINIVMIGKYFEGKAQHTIKREINNVFPQGKLLSKTKATWIRQKNRKFEVIEEREMDLSLIEKNDLIRIKSGDYILFDGTVMFGEVEIINTMQNGETNVETKSMGDKIFGGTEIVGGSGVLKIDNVLEKSLIFELTKQMKESLTKRFEFQNIIDTISKLFVPMIITLSIITFCGWYFVLKNYPSTAALIGNKNQIVFAFEKALSVLVISCPCALGLAIPTVITVSLNKAVKNGILVKSAAALERCRNVNAFVFDKTGTLLHNFRLLSNFEYIEDPASQLVDINVMWKIVEGVEDKVIHPLGELLYREALRRTAQLDRKIDAVLVEKKNVTNGMLATLNYRPSEDSDVCETLKVVIGNKLLFGKQGFTDLANHQKKITMYEDLGKTVIIIGINNLIRGLFIIDNQASLRPEAKEIINELTKAGKEVYILSGDQQKAVDLVGESLGLPPNRVIGEADPNMKKDFLIKLREERHLNAMMIGDGLNDIISIAEAYIGVTMNAKSELNLIASDVIILKEDLANILNLVKLANYTMYFIYINLTWAFIYNLIAIPFASGVFYVTLGIDIPPYASSIAMSASSLLIVITSSLFKFVKLKHGDQTAPGAVIQSSFKETSPLAENDPRKEMESSLLRKA